MGKKNCGGNQKALFGEKRPLLLLIYFNEFYYLSENAKTNDVCVLASWHLNQVQKVGGKQCCITE